VSLVFVSVVRQGLSRGLPTADAAAADLATGSLATALGIRAQATLGGDVAPEVAMQLLGPGDVAGIDPGIVLRTDPPAGAQYVDTTLFPLIEFDPPGLPWMFTPLAAADDRLRPWIALVVVPYEDGESPLDLEPLRRGRLPVLKIEDADDLPPIDQTWAWAHAQLSTADVAATVPAGLDELMAGNPGASLSRLLWPRKLTADRHYVACVVPTFEAARLAGLGQAPGSVLAQAWGPGVALPLHLPVYHHWEFFTADAGNFEEAVRRLRGTDPPAAAGRVLDATDPGDPAVREPKPLPLTGALRPEKLKIPQYAGTAVQGFQALARTGRVVTGPGGAAYPVVDLPLYGGRHAGVTDATGGPQWVQELNTDHRHRAAAALGARIVRDNQEALMRSAWEQAGAVEEANRRLRRARLGRAASARIVARHITPLGAAERLRVLAPGFARLGMPATDRTLAALVADSRLPELLLGPAFTALTRPSGRIGRHLAPPKVVPGLVEGIDGRTLDPDRADVGRPGGLVTLDGVLALADAARDSVRAGGGRTPIALGAVTPAAPGPVRLTAAATAGDVRDRATEIRLTDRAGVLGASATLTGDFALPAAAATRRIDPSRLTADRVRALTGSVEIDVAGTLVDLTSAHRTALADLFEPAAPGAVLASPALDFAKVAVDALKAVEPGAAIARAVLARLDLPDDPGRADALDDVLASPQFPAPLAPELIRIAPDLVLPGLDEVERDRVFAVLSNAPFVFAVLAGANYEVMRELRWRGYPTDERGTAFHRFWCEDADEIGDLHTIQAGALGDAVKGSGSGVVVVIRSDLLARFPGTLVYAVAAKPAGAATTPDFSKVELPVFRGTLAPDVAYFGFPFGATTATGSPGRYLAFQEPATSPSFGLDVPGETPAPLPANANELSWSNVPMTGAFVDPTPATGRPEFKDVKATWGRNAADQAAATYQRPVRAAIHFRELLGGP
jgi:hypothetical protein